MTFDIIQSHKQKQSDYGVTNDYIKPHEILKKFNVAIIYIIYFTLKKL